MKIKHEGHIIDREMFFVINILLQGAHHSEAFL